MTPAGACRSTSASRAARRAAASASLRGRGPIKRGQDLLRDRPVHRQPVRGQLGAQQFGGGLATGRRHGHRPWPAWPAPPAVSQPPQGPVVGPPGHPLGAVRPAAADPLGAQVPVRRHRVAAVAVVHAEQVERPVGRHRLGGQPAQPGPGPAGVGAPATEQQPVRGGDVPARRQPHPVGRHLRPDLARPHHPPGPHHPHPPARPRRPGHRLLRPATPGPPWPARGLVAAEMTSPTRSPRFTPAWRNDVTSSAPATDPPCHALTPSNACPVIDG